MRGLFIFSLIFQLQLSHASTPAEPDFDSLGGNAILFERARQLEPEKDVRVVQSRTVNRRQRVELDFDMARAFGGETYMNTRTVGLAANYHFNPRLSAGLKYSYAFNTLTAEGRALVDRAAADFQVNPENPSVPFPELDYVKSEVLALGQWYPIYGKLNLMDRAVAHFDVYGLGGGGQIWLRSGPTATYTAGLGVGFWFQRQFSARVEMRYQTYRAQYLSGEQKMDLTIGSVQVGYLL